MQGIQRKSNLCVHGSFKVLSDIKTTRNSLVGAQGLAPLQQILQRSLGFAAQTRRLTKHFLARG
jgi:hypothetical protein